MQLLPLLLSLKFPFTAFQFLGWGLTFSPCRALWQVRQTSPSLWQLWQDCRFLLASLA